jgi:phosphatidylglycerol:prolipoprotein diacylglycerol transferase
MFPELFRIGNFPINTYGVLLALALLLGIYISARVGTRDGLPRERIYDLGLLMVVGAILGSKLLLLWTEPEYRQNLWHLFSLDFLRSGGVFYGGLLGATLAIYLGVRHYKLPWWPTADAGACSLPLGQAIGRMGCFSAGCCWGKPTTHWWGVTFTEQGHEITGVPIDVPLHPTQLYEAGATLLLFFFLLWLHRKKRFHGQVVLAYAIIYSVVRFVIEFYRDDPRGDIAGLTTLTGLSSSQLISIVLIIASVITYFIRRKTPLDRKAREVSPVPASV